MKWHEYCYGREREEDYEVLLFKSIEYVLQNNLNIPADLKVFLNQSSPKKWTTKIEMKTI